MPAVSAVALGSTLNIDDVYLFIDPLIGNRNVLNLVVHLLMGVGMAELSRLLLQATGRTGSSSKHLTFLLTVGSILAVLQAALLVVSDTQGSATNFTDIFAGIPTIAWYQATFFGWVGVILGYTGAECLLRDKAGESHWFSIGFNILGIGCLSGLVAITLKMLLIFFEVEQFWPKENPYEGPVYLAYRIFIAIGIVCFGIGFSVPSYSRIRAIFAARKARAMDLDTLRPIMRRLMLTPEGRLSREAARISLRARTSKTQLYRWFIFIGDIRVLGPDLLNEAEKDLIDKVGRKFEHDDAADRFTDAGL
ncbi:hypothetical protein ANMWB30_24300 [Arthrobacter sp. MWB30]|nr:hypothetical protein ANMWB30_24300 [Arthrobacter sp. MWB30]